MGKVRKVVVHGYPGPSGERLPREDLPEGLDWDKWLGQAPDILYNNKYIFLENEPGCSGYYAFSGGEMTGWGAHGFDQVLWALGTDAPVGVQAAGDGPDQPHDAHGWWRPSLPGH